MLLASIPSKRFATAVFVSTMCLVLTACGGGGGGGYGGGSGGSSGGGATPSTVSGVAALGAPLTSAAVTLKSQNGTSRTATTDVYGSFSIDITGLTAPFLLKVDLPSGASLYSVGGAAGVVNVHPFTDLIIQTWYKVQGKTIDIAFSNPVGNPPPTATQIQVIASTVKDIVKKWLTDNGIDPTNFDLISSAFNANGSGFDHVLKISTINTNGTITITDGTTTQTTTVTLDTATSGVSISTTTTSGTKTSSSVSSIVVPTSSAQQTALNGVTAMLNQFVTTVNGRGANLADTDLVGLFDAAYLDAGFGGNIEAARFASTFRGITFNSFIVDRILSYDDSTKLISIVGTASITQNGTTLTKKTNNALIFKQQTDSSWRFYGNQRPSSGGLQVEMRTDVFPPCPSTTTCGTTGPRRHINVDVRAPKGTVSTVTISGGGVFNNTIVPKSNAIEVETIANTSTTQITVQKDTFFTGVDASPAAGTVFTFTVTPVSGPPVSFTVTTAATTTDPIAITSPTGHTLADAKLGQPLTVNWTRPTTFAVESVGLGGNVLTAPPGSPGFQCQVDVNVAATAASGAITFPSTCNGQPAVSATINVSTTGPNGERNIVLYFFSG